MQRTVATAELPHLPHQFVVFAVPCLTRYVSVEFHGSMMQVTDLLRNHGISRAERFVTGDCFVDHARDRLATEFLTQFPAATDFFFVDDDIGFPAEKVIEFLNRPEAVVAGMYPKKQDLPDGQPTWPLCFEIVDGRFLQNGDGLYSAILAPTGFMRIKRWFLEELVKGRRTYMEDNGDGTSGMRYHLFDAGLPLHCQEWTGEDRDFCDKVRALGERIWVDADITFAHRGTKRWEGNVAAYMKANIEDIQGRVASAWAAHQTEIAKLEADAPKPLMPAPA